MSSTKKEKKETGTKRKEPNGEAAKEKTVVAPAAEDEFDSIFGVEHQKAEPQKKNRVSKGAGGGSDSNTSSCILRGIVIDVRKESFTNKEGNPVLKTRVFVAVDQVSDNGDMSLVRGGIPGLDYLLPTRKLDLPQQAEKRDDKFLAKPRVLQVEKDSKARWLGLVAPSFYNKTPKGDDTGVQQCKPGMQVELRGIQCAEGTGKNSDKIYVNATKITPLLDKPVLKHELPQALMEAACSINQMKWSSFAYSMCMGGYDGIHFPEEVMESQAEACRMLWQGSLVTAGDRIELMASSNPGATGDALQAHSARVRGLSMNVFTQSPRYFNEEGYDHFLAPIVQTGITPTNRMPTAMQKMRTGDAANCVDLPDYFMTSTVANVKTSPNGGRLDVEFNLQFIFDKEKALASKQAGGKMPILHTGSFPGAATQFMTNEFAHCMGTMVKSKVAWLADQVLPIAEMVVWARVFPKDSPEAGITSEWPQTWAIDVPKTMSHGILVSEKWLLKTVCGGLVQYVPDAVPAEDKFLMPTEQSEMPAFAESRYQELTYGGWKISNLKVPVGYKREFRVLYDGAVATLSDKENGPILSSDAEKGEEHIEMVGASAAPDGEEFDVGAFLSGSCVIYAILVPVGLE